MPLIYAGIDEAGYGPLLGPLCVGCAVFEVRNWTDGEPAPDLWNLLSRAVCRETRDKRHRIAIDDSKKLKLANSVSTRHPLIHLERGVLSFLGCLADAQPVSTDLDLFLRTGASRPDRPWYAGDPAPCPVGSTPGEIAIARSSLAGTLEHSGVALHALHCDVLGEVEFNELVHAAGTKAATTEAALVKHLWTIWEKWGSVGAQAGEGVRVVCDRQGGRTQYTDMLQRAFPDATVIATHESPTQSRYELRARERAGGERHMHVLFLTESEQQHLPVALASMLAKYTREMLMARFNRYWCARMPELKPTAGYRNDGWRWLEDARAVISEGERGAMIRRA